MKTVNVSFIIESKKKKQQAVTAVFFHFTNITN